MQVDLKNWALDCYQRTCTHRITNLPTQVNISNNVYFLWNCHNMYTLLILDKDKYLIYSLRVTERVKCGHSIQLKHRPCQKINHTKTSTCQNINHAKKSITIKHEPCQKNKKRFKKVIYDFPPSKCQD